MTTRKMDKQTLDEVMNNMITTVIDSKSQVFDIVEDTRSEYERLRVELEEVKVQVVEKIENTARLDLLVRAARQKLMEVDGDFKRYTEAQVKDAYEMAQNIQEQHILSLKEEKVLIHRRNELERRLQTLLDQLRRAELLIGTYFNYFKLSSKEQTFSKLVKFSKMRNKKQAFGFKVNQAQEEEH